MMKQFPPTSKNGQSEQQRNDSILRRGDRVRLLSKPTGYTAQHLPLTVGGIYIIRYLDGSNVCTSTDVAGYDGNYSSSCVEKVIDKKP